jgi:hypothetical protein
MTDTFASGPSSSLGGSHESPPGISDVTSTLAELEGKLRELEHELASIGRRPMSVGDTPALTDERPEIPRAPGASETGSRLIDEVVERAAPGSVPLSPSASPPAAAPTPAFPSAPTSAPVPAFKATPAAAQASTATPAHRPSAPELAGLAELRLFRDRLERFSQELAEDYEQVLERVMGDFSAGPAPVPSLDDTLFEGPVELGVGPFYDIGSLSTFERQVAQVPHAHDVAVRRFEASHAVIDLTLSAPVALVRELRAHLEIGFSVREIAGARLMLTFDDI